MAVTQLVFPLSSRQTLRTAVEEVLTLQGELCAEVLRSLAPPRAKSVASPGRLSSSRRRLLEDGREAHEGVNGSFSGSFSGLVARVASHAARLRRTVSGTAWDDDGADAEAWPGAVQRHSAPCRVGRRGPIEDAVFDPGALEMGARTGVDATKGAPLAGRAAAERWVGASSIYVPGGGLLRRLRALFRQLSLEEGPALIQDDPRPLGPVFMGFYDTVWPVRGEGYCRTKGDA